MSTTSTRLRVMETVATAAPASERVGMARAVSMEPKVLLVDKPFGALDPLTQAHLQDTVMQIHARLGNT